MSHTERKLIFVELNEINFELVEAYIAKGESLPGFKLLIDEGVIRTSGETSYELLEPWIQWPSVHTGMSFEEHKVFRLGDFVHSGAEQFFETLERAGFVVGAISPMNAANRLATPAYFIPDPWTRTQSDTTFFGRHLSAALKQAVNDNSRAKLTLTTVMRLLLSFIALVRPKRYFYFMKLALQSLGRPWRKAIFLDKFLHEIHMSLWAKRCPNFSVLFLNAGAHIQHHYLLSSSVVRSINFQNPQWYVHDADDPYLEVLQSYDETLRDLKSMKNTELIVATGLSQIPYENPIFYYRLRDHKLFLQQLGLEFADVAPRMTRDFLITFRSSEAAASAQRLLSGLLVDDGLPLFGEIDNRGLDLFVVLTYPHEITSDRYLIFGERRIALLDSVVFVAIKNGEHQTKGFVYLSPGLKQYGFHDDSHVSCLHNVVLDFFKIKR